MDAVSADASKLALEGDTGNRIQLINNIQEAVRSVIGNLERVDHDLEKLKASFKEEGIVFCDHEMTFIGTNFADQKFRQASK